MRTIFFSIIIVVFSLSVAAQGVKPGVLAGINFQNLNGKNQAGDKLTNTLIPAFHAGVNVLIPIAPEIYFQPGIIFSMKGANIDALSKPKVNLNYIEVPLNLVYRGQLGNNFVLLGFGPYVAYAVSGKLKVGSLSENIHFANSISQTTTGMYTRAFDAGANIFAGYELEGGLFVQLDAQLGLYNINPKINNVSNDKSTLKNTGFGLSVGYRF